MQELNIYNNSINPVTSYPEDYVEKESKLKDFDNNTKINEIENNDISRPDKITYNFLTQLKSYLGREEKKLNFINGTQKKF